MKVRSKPTEKEDNSEMDTFVNKTSQERQSAEETLLRKGSQQKKRLLRKDSQQKKQASAVKRAAILVKGLK